MRLIAQVDRSDNPATIRSWDSTEAERKAKAKADAEAATRRATDAQVLEDAERLIAAWNERQARRMPMLLPLAPERRFIAFP